MGRTFKKILRYTLIALFALVFLFIASTLGIYAYLQTDSGKKWLSKELSSMLGAELETLVEVNNVDWDFPGIVHLDSLLMKDHRDSSMIFIRHVDAKLSYYNFATGKITFNSVSLDGVDFRLRRYIGDEASNFAYLLRKLQSGTSTGKRTQLLFKSVTLNDAEFSWYDYKKPRASQGIDWDYIDVHDINGRINLFYIDGADFGGKVKTLAFHERSGFTLSDLRTRMSYTPQEMSFTNLMLRTPNSLIRNYLQFTYDDPVQFSDFIDSIQIAADFVNSKVSFADLWYFAPKLQNKESKVALNAEVSGTIADMKIRDAALAFGDHSSLEGNLSMRGLPQIDETFISAKLGSAQTSYYELAHLLPELNLPGQIAKLGMVDMHGNFTGFLNDFVAFGTLNTDIGRIKTDLNLKISENVASTRYSGRLELDDFDAGEFTGEDIIGHITGRGEIIGTGVSSESIKAKVNAAISAIELNDYRYSNVNVNGDIRKKAFEGLLTIHDPNADLDFKGTIDYDKPVPELDFTADIRKVQLYALNITKDSLQVQTNVTLDISGIKLDDIQGNIMAKDTRLTLPNRIYMLDSILLTSKKEGRKRDVTIASELMNAHLQGDFIVSQLPDLLKNTTNRFVDSNLVHFTEIGLVEEQYIDFDIQFADLDFVAKLLDNKLSIHDSGFVKGSIASGNGKVSLSAVVPEISFENIRFRDLEVNGAGADSALSLYLQSASFSNKDSVMAQGIKLSTTFRGDTVLFDIFAADDPGIKKANLTGSLDIRRDLTYLNLMESKLYIHDTAWDITARPIIVYPDTMVSFPLVSFRKGDQRLNIIGSYSEKNPNPIRFILENLEIHTLATFVPDISEFSGDLNGQVLVYHISTTPIVEAAVFVSPLVRGEDTLGTLTATASFNQAEQKLTIDAGIENNLYGQKVLTAKGYAIFKNGRENLNLDIALNKTELRIFEPVVEGVFSDLQGFATANMKITGTLKEPKIDGMVDFTDAAMTITYLNTSYHFSHQAVFEGKEIKIQDLRLLDPSNNVAELNGTITLESLSLIVLDLRVQADNFLVLNTTSQQNDDFYGKAYGTGYLTIDGPLDDLRMYANMRTERNTAFALPVSQGTTVSGHDYIRFISKDKYLQEQRDIKLSGIQISLDIEATTDAFVQIIFDPRVGDIMEGRGTGAIRMDVNTEGDFSMYGVYTIREGSYRFTAWDIISKDFSINEGSSITWTGDPYEAQLDVKASYFLQASVQPLLINLSSKDSITQNFTYPVETKLALTGALLSPEIKLDFDIRGLNTGSINQSASLFGLENQLTIIRNNEQELNRQIVGLLVFNQFLPVNDPSSLGFGQNGSNAGYTGVSALISSQLNYLLRTKLPASLSDDVQLGVDYRSLSAPSATGNHLDLTLRGNLELLNDRVNVGGSYDVYSNNYNLLLSYLLTQNGNLRLKAFRRSDANPISVQESSSTSGVGIFVRKQFDKLGDLFKKEEEED